MRDPERRETRSVGTIYVWIVQRCNGFDGGGFPIVGSIVEVLAYVSYFDMVAAAEKYTKQPSKFYIAKFQPHIKAGVTYAGSP